MNLASTYVKAIPTKIMVAMRSNVVGQDLGITIRTESPNTGYGYKYEACTCKVSLGRHLPFLSYQALVHPC